ncbi:hypothetical protein QBC41DRAFT_136284 [Cercophora samala]|uniref:Uncharacterized protein n=1 Tax=Cercophora samala TaxID=330535 RepID=A0AA40DE42_9PEZI|nr:hypothetical protein QBC41DRAFT_136284 [Cercophora samala]
MLRPDRRLEPLVRLFVLFFYIFDSQTLLSILYTGSVTVWGWCQHSPFFSPGFNNQIILDESQFHTWLLDSSNTMGCPLASWSVFLHRQKYRFHSCLAFLRYILPVYIFKNRWFCCVGTVLLGRHGESCFFHTFTHTNTPLLTPFSHFFRAFWWSAFFYFFFSELFFTRVSSLLLHLYTPPLPFLFFQHLSYH